MTLTDDAAGARLADDGTGGVVLLRAAGVALLVDARGADLPRVLHWGADPGPLDPSACRRLADDLQVAVPNAVLDDPWPFTLLPGQADGWAGTPGLAGSRDDGVSYPRWRTDAVESVTEDDGAPVLICRASDPAIGLQLVSQLRLEAGGLVRIRHTVSAT